MLRSNVVIVMDLYGLDNGLTNIDDLPLTNEEKQIVEHVQVQDKTLSRYLLKTHGAHNLIEIKDIPSLDGCCVDLRAGKVYDQDGKEVKYYGVGYNRMYFKDSKDNYLHRVVAYQYARLTNPELYKDAMANPKRYEVHHKDPAIRNLPHGNGITNVVLLPKGLHRKYTEITKKLRDEVMVDGKEIPLVKDGFYHTLG